MTPPPLDKHPPELLLLHRAGSTFFIDMLTLQKGELWTHVDLVWRQNHPHLSASNRIRVDLLMVLLWEQRFATNDFPQTVCDLLLTSGASAEPSWWWRPSPESRTNILDHLQQKSNSIPFFVSKNFLLIFCYSFTQRVTLFSTTCLHHNNNQQTLRWSTQIIKNHHKGGPPSSSPILLLTGLPTSSTPQHPPSSICMGFQCLCGVCK